MGNCLSWLKETFFCNVHPPHPPHPTREECIKKLSEGIDKWEIAALISGTTDILNSQQKQTEKSSTIAATSTAKTPMLSTFLESGSTFLEFVDGYIEKTSVKGMGEGVEILSETLQQLGNIHWIVGGLSIVGYLLSKFEQVSTNRRNCMDLLKSMLDLMNHIKNLNTLIPEKQNQWRDALLLVGEGCILCASHIQSGKFFRFVKTSVDAKMLNNLSTRIDHLYQEMTMTIVIKGFMTQQQQLAITQQLAKTLVVAQPTHPGGLAEPVNQIIVEEPVGLVEPVYLKGSAEEFSPSLFPKKLASLEWAGGLEEPVNRITVEEPVGLVEPVYLRDSELTVVEEKEEFSPEKLASLEWAVGLQEPVNQIIEMLELEKPKERAEVLVIYGFRGIGKTTLAKAVFANLDLADFNYTSIEINEFPQQNDLKRMQEQLLKDVFPEYQDGGKITLTDCNEGRYHLTQAFESERNKPVFILIDNALREKDLKEFLPEDLGGLSPRSRILVTARDLSVTDFFEERGLSRRRYRVNTLTDDQAEKILCNDPVKLEQKQIKDVVKKSLQICGGIPLALQIVGAQLRNSDNISELFQALEKGNEIKQ